MQTATKLIDISILQKSLDPVLSHSMLFIHALSGCDTTSRPYGIGKLSTMAKYCSLQEFSRIFMLENQNYKDIEPAGNQALATLYGCMPGKDLNFQRASKFTEKVASSSSYLPPERLPPTSDAARFHSRRVYLQVQAWLGKNMEPTEWGWLLHRNQHGIFLKPCRMEQAARPESILRIIKCNCTGKCNKNTCSCRKNGLLCTLACGQCKEITCTNGQPHDSSDNID